MARRHANSRAQRKQRASSQGKKGKQPRGKQKEKSQEVRRSTRLKGISRLRKSENRAPSQEHLSVLVEENDLSPLPLKGHKRHREVEHPVNDIPTERPPKRLRPSPVGCSPLQTFGQEINRAISVSERSHISYWAERKTWPKEFYQQDNMHPLIAKPKSTASLRRKRSEPSLITSTTPSDQRPREEKSAPYRNANYPTLLETLGGSYMDESKLGITQASKVLCQNLLEEKYITPKDTLFRDDVFHAACRNLQNKNEARIIQDIARLLVPSPETLAAFGDKNLDILVESVNEGWNSCNPVTNPRPQPDFSVGFGRSIFSDDQLSKLQPLLGDLSCLSYFRATFYMYFPFLTCEVKCGITGLDIADRQNAHSNTLAVRGIFELFKLAKRENELHGEVLTFSISHDHRTVRLYGYYPIIEGPKPKIYRRPIHTYDITALNGKEKWTTWNFTVAVFTYSLTLRERICSLIDELPAGFSLELSEQFEPQISETSGLSQQLEDQIFTEAPGSQSSHVDLQHITPATSTQAVKPASKKKKEKKKV